MIKMKKVPCNDNRLAWSVNLLWVALFAVVMWLFMYAMPRYGDDIGYLHLFHDWYADRGLNDTDEGIGFTSGFPWREIADTWTFRYHDDHARLAMLVSSPLLLAPKWVGVTVMTILLMVAFRATLAISGIDWRRSALVPLLVVLMAAVLPWRDGLTELVFQLNYIPGTAFTMLLLVWLRKRQAYGAAVCMAAFAFGLLAGGWHEGIALPAGCGLLAVYLLEGKGRDRRTLCAAAGMLTATALLLAVPGMRARMARTEAPGLGPVELIYFIMAAWPCLAVVVWGAVRAIRARLRKAPIDRLMVFGLVGIMVSLAIALRSGQFLRAGWWAYFMACVMAVYLLRTGYPAFWSRYTWRNSAIWAPLLALTFVWLGYVDCYALRIRQIADRQLSEWLVAPGRSRFAAITQFSDIPAICGYLPYSGYYTDIYYESLKFCAADPDEFGGYDSLWGVVPEALRNVADASGEAVPGGSGVRIKDGYLFMAENAGMERELRRNDCSVSDWEMMVDYGSGMRPMRVKQVSFRSEGDGRRYSYLVVGLGWKDAHFRDVRAISPDMKFMAPDR